VAVSSGGPASPHYRERLTPSLGALVAAFLVCALPLLLFGEVVVVFFAGPETMSHLGVITLAAAVGLGAALVALYSGWRLHIVVDDAALAVRLWSRVPLGFVRTARLVTGRRELWRLRNGKGANVAVLRNLSPPWIGQAFLLESDHGAWLVGTRVPAKLARALIEAADTPEGVRATLRAYA
jgi:hypothetical protein